MTTEIQLRRGTASAWTAANPVLGSGEPGLETDTLKEKRGDGATAWNQLPYSVIPQGGPSGVKLIYVNSAYPARPSGLAGGLVTYVGPTQPTDGVTFDQWIKTS